MLSSPDKSDQDWVLRHGERGAPVIEIDFSLGCAPGGFDGDHVVYGWLRPGTVDLLVRFIGSIWFNWFDLVRLDLASSADLVGPVCGCWYPLETSSQCGNLRAPMIKNVWTMYILRYVPEHLIEYIPQI